MIWRVRCRLLSCVLGTKHKFILTNPGLTIERHEGDRRNYSFQGKVSPNIRLRLCGYRLTGSICDGQMGDHNG